MVTTPDTRGDEAWAALAERDERSRVEAMRERFRELARLDEDERLAQLRAMIAAEYSLPEAVLADFTRSRLYCWVEMGREDPEAARRIGAGYDRVFSEMPAELAMKRASAVQTTATRHLSPEDIDVLFDVIPGLVRQLPRRRIAVTSEGRTQTPAKTTKQRGTLWARLVGRAR